MTFQEQIPIQTIRDAAQMARNTCMEQPLSEAVRAKRAIAVWGVWCKIEEDTSVVRTGLVGQEYFTHLIARALTICRETGEREQEQGVNALMASYAHLIALEGVKG